MNPQFDPEWAYFINMTKNFKEDLEIDKEKIDCINKIVDTWLDYQQFMRRIPGISIGIIHKDKIIFSKGYGYSNVKKKKKITEKTLYRIASISKIFTAISIMQLVEKEKIYLDDSVTKYLPWLKSEEKITVRQLLTHSSGINRDGSTSHWVNDDFPEIEKIKRHVEEGAISYSPIEKFKYSNLGYTLLGSVIEQVSGFSYAEYVKRNIIEKIGLEKTYVDINEIAEKELATGYGRDIPNLKREEFKNPSTRSMASAAGFVSNSIDLCKFISAQFLGNKLLLSKDTKKEMQRTHWIEENDNQTINWGMGYEIWKNDDVKLRGHGGGFPGFITRIAFDREKEIGVALLTNSLGGRSLDLTNGVFHIINYVLKNWNEFESIEDKNMDLSKYEGRYSERGDDVEIVEINGSLNFFYPKNIKPLKEIYKLKHKKENTFTIETGGNFDYIGENVTFHFNESNKLDRVNIGPNPLIPFKDYIDKL